LDSGGLIPNYYCTSRCRHCLYACSPKWDKQYIDTETTEKNILKIKSLGCQSIHIGGGEPFLNLDGLKMVIERVHSLGVELEYVETNSSWYKDEESASQVLSSLSQRGISTLLNINECVS
jgi:organic radical activating enzyme